MSLDPSTGAGLVHRIASGDTAAEAELVSSVSRTLRFLAGRVTRREADAEDLVQETLLRALEKIRRGEVREPERLAGFLRSLLKNLAVQGYRRRHHDAERSDAELPEAADARSSGPLARLLGAERIRITREVLAELPTARDREVLLRYYLGEEPSRDICADLDLPAEHFHRVLHRARNRYRKLWEQHHG